MSRPSVPTPPHAPVREKLGTVRMHDPLGQPGCKDCCGIGVVHVQVKGQLRVERKPCPCTVDQQFNQVRDERLARLQRDVP